MNGRAGVHDGPTGLALCLGRSLNCCNIAFGQTRKVRRVGYQDEGFFIRQNLFRESREFLGKVGLYADDLRLLARVEHRSIADQTVIGPFQQTHLFGI